MKEMPILEAKDLHKAFRSFTYVEVLKGVNLTVSAGETVAIVGRSGEGKSTLLHILGTLEKPTKGTLTITGHSVNFSNTSQLRNQHIGFVYQAFHLLEDYSVIDNILLPAKIARQPVGKGSVASELAHQLLEKVGLSDRINFNTKLLSGGERQRVAIARALINDPDLILADEPSGNLDLESAQIIHDLLFDLAKNQGKAVVIVTHSADLASQCSRKLGLKAGGIQ